MKKIVFISDFFVENISGGAEICDQVLIQQLEQRDIKVCKFNSKDFTEKHLHLYLQCGFNFIVSNFVGLSEGVKKLFTLEYFKCHKPWVFFMVKRTNTIY